MFFKQKQRFSIRKYSFGAASVLLGTVLLGLAGPEAAAETVTKDTVELTNPTVTDDGSAPSSTSEAPATDVSETQPTSAEPFAESTAPTATEAAEETASEASAVSEEMAETSEASQPETASEKTVEAPATSEASATPVEAAPAVEVAADSATAVSETTTSEAAAQDTAADDQAKMAELEALKVKTEAAISSYNLLSDAVKASYIARLKETSDLAVLELLAQEAKKAQKRAETFPTYGQPRTSYTGFRAITPATAPTAAEVLDNDGWTVLKRFSNKPGIFYVQQSGTVNGGKSTDKSTIIYEVDTKSGTITPVSKDDFEGGGTLYDKNVEISKQQGFGDLGVSGTGESYRAINAPWTF
ncbi:YSIRK-type signal peptide-containing protein [Streptococcus thoraltensis]|uniref:YSIRK-type signal peptide-containing protein n=1 Tax=Streptococcus thoraltensis TaxID=55085 RepID=UPI00035D340A|nr:YSIRK-type signal peptide-containing protein [Streptococcus thoraltensis]MDY4760482.1 YSIRK-type signal peptide-containing protein [Streptococcus thoraltensis]